jgi:uncharacterized protein
MFFIQSGYFILRISLGIIIPVLIGFLISLMKFKNAYNDMQDKILCECHDHGKEEHPCSQKGFSFLKGKLKHIMEHATEDFFETGKYFIIGAFFTSIFQILIPRSIFLGIGNNLFLSIILMMLFEFFLSICSNTDAFIARSFLGQFTQGSVLAFVLFGQ